MTGGVSAGIGALGPATPRGVVFQEQDALKCVDPLTGDQLWARADIPTGCELFGDMEYVFAADVSGRTIHVLRMVDGDIVGKRELPKHEWLLTVGRNIAEVGFKMSRESRLLSIRISDIFSGETLYEHEFPIASRVAVLEPHSIAVFEPTGKFRLIDARNGDVVIDEQLDPVADLQNIYVMGARDKLFLMVSGQVNQQYKPLVQQPDFPMINGLIYAFSSETGKPLWPAPAVVRNRGIVLSQPPDLPVLVFTDRKLVRDPATGGASQLRVLCIDQSTGQTVYRNDTLADTSITRFRIRGERETEPQVAIEMNAGKIQLAMTDRPRPPQPPANDDLETMRSSEERGLRGIGQRMSGVLKSALENPAERERLRQLELIEQARREALKAQQEKLRQLQIERFKKQAEEKKAERNEVPQTDDD
jgi:outer membrane protein assembly factor BamB